jgi:hypothetical protein
MEEGSIVTGEMLMVVVNAVDDLHHFNLIFRGFDVGALAAARFDNKSFMRGDVNTGVDIREGPLAGVVNDTESPIKQTTRRAVQSVVLDVPRSYHWPTVALEKLAMEVFEVLRT